MIIALQESFYDTDRFGEVIIVSATEKQHHVTNLGKRM